MNREIKFRYWNPFTKTLVYNPKVFKEGWTLEQYFSERGWIWEQYTGLKDKNGKEIYEGDIIKILPLDGIEYIDEPVKVVFEETAFLMRCCCHNSLITEETGYPWALGFMKDGVFEVIGNIHENPELLEGMK